ncbi:MAG: hypothetical protein MJE12_28675 [Alphaproteobacteria bacterium]|nr:hypothetical protein [Alphaproteobacteria bacterium]
MLLFGVSAPGAASDVEPLTDAQVERFASSFEAILNVVSKYWGDRRFTPHGRILPHRGTIDRAMAEMKVEGTLQDFERLFTDYGFAGYDAWKQMGQRITNAQFQLMAEKRSGQPFSAITPERRKALEQQRDFLMTPNPQMSDEQRLRELKRLNDVMAEHDKWEIAKGDMTVVRKYQERIVALGRKRQRLARIARKENAQAPAPAAPISSQAR